MEFMLVIFETVAGKLFAVRQQQAVEAANR
jgi:hypothetical protein